MERSLDAESLARVSKVRNLWRNLELEAERQSQDGAGSPQLGLRREQDEARSPNRFRRRPVSPGSPQNPADASPDIRNKSQLLTGHKREGNLRAKTASMNLGNRASLDAIAHTKQETRTKSRSKQHHRRRSREDKSLPSSSSSHQRSSRGPKENGESDTDDRDAPLQHARNPSLDSEISAGEQRADSAVRKVDEGAGRARATLVSQPTAPRVVQSESSLLELRTATSPEGIVTTPGKDSRRPPSPRERPAALMSTSLSDLLAAGKGTPGVSRGTDDAKFPQRTSPVAKRSPLSRGGTTSPGEAAPAKMMDAVREQLAAAPMASRSPQEGKVRLRRPGKYGDSMRAGLVHIKRAVALDGRGQLLEAIVEYEAGIAYMQSASAGDAHYIDPESKEIDAGLCAQYIRRVARLKEKNQMMAAKDTHTAEQAQSGIHKPAVQSAAAHKPADTETTEVKLVAPADVSQPEVNMPIESDVKLRADSYSFVNVDDELTTLVGRTLSWKCLSEADSLGALPSRVALSVAEFHRSLHQSRVKERDVLKASNSDDRAPNFRHVMDHAPSVQTIKTHTFARHALALRDKFSSIQFLAWPDLEIRAFYAEQEARADLAVPNEESDDAVSSLPIARDSALRHLSDIREWVRTTREAVKLGEEPNDLENTVGAVTNLLGFVANALSLDAPGALNDKALSYSKQSLHETRLEAVLREFDSRLSSFLALILSAADVDANSSDNVEAAVNMTSASRLLSRAATMCTGHTIADDASVGSGSSFLETLRQSRVRGVVVPCSPSDTVSTVLGLVAAKAKFVLEKEVGMFFRLSYRNDVIDGQTRLCDVAAIRQKLEFGQPFDTVHLDAFVDFRKPESVLDDACSLPEAWVNVTPPPPAPDDFLASQSLRLPTEYSLRGKLVQKDAEVVRFSPEMSWAKRPFRLSVAAMSFQTGCSPLRLARTASLEDSEASLSVQLEFTVYYGKERLGDTVRIIADSSELINAKSDDVGPIRLNCRENGVVHFEDISLARLAPGSELCVRAVLASATAGGKGNRKNLLLGWGHVPVWDEKFCLIGTAQCTTDLGLWYPAESSNGSESDFFFDQCPHENGTPALEVRGSESDVVLSLARIHLDGFDVGGTGMEPPSLVLSEPNKTVLEIHPRSLSVAKSKQDRAKQLEKLKGIVREALTTRTIRGRSLTRAKLSDVMLGHFWEARKYILSLEGGIWLLLSLPRLVNWSDPGSRIEARRWLRHHLNSNPGHATAADMIQLLGAQYRDPSVRKFACDVLGTRGSDELAVSDEEFMAFLPQLVQALRHEQHHLSDLATLLLKRALGSLNIAQALFWHLRTELNPMGDGPISRWMHRSPPSDASASADWDLMSGDTMTIRCHLMLEALLLGCGRKVRGQLLKQVDLVRQLGSVAAGVMLTKDTTRRSQFRKLLSGVVLHPPFSLPLDPGLMLDEIVVSDSRIFESKTIPFLISLQHAEHEAAGNEACESNVLRVIFKAGDDLRQDILVTQLIATFARMWRADGLDLAVTQYNIVATSQNSGLIEVVPGRTLSDIQTEYAGSRGAFSKKYLYRWLRAQFAAGSSASKLEVARADAAFEHARQRFVRSLAAYCVATYVLGIGDRHNDNVMVSPNGQLFHIDFGRVLGNWERFAGVSRDRAPFVFTPDLAYIVNTCPDSDIGSRDVVGYKTFVNLCGAAFNTLRRNVHVVVNLLLLMVQGGLPELQKESDVNFVVKRLHLALSEEEAEEFFSDLVSKSLKARSTQVNFYFHNLAAKKGKNRQKREDL